MKKSFRCRKRINDRKQENRAKITDRSSHNGNSFRTERLAWLLRRFSTARIEPLWAKQNDKTVSSDATERNRCLIMIALLRVHYKARTKTRIPKELQIPTNSKSGSCWFLQHKPSTCLILFVYKRLEALRNGINSQEQYLYIKVHISIYIQ